MRRIKSFEEYLKEGIVRKVTPDVQRAENLFMESKRKYVLLQKIIKHMGIDNENANEYLESCYSIMLQVQEHTKRKFPMPKIFLLVKKSLNFLINYDILEMEFSIMEKGLRKTMHKKLLIF